jgi:hypothetical protein
VVGVRRFVLLACAVSVALGCLVGVQLTAHADNGPPPPEQQQPPPPDPPPDPPPVEVPPGDPVPKAVLMKGNKELQTGRLGTHCWNGCADWLSFPKPATTPRVAPGSSLHIRIKYAQRPAYVGGSVGNSLDTPPWWVNRSFSLKPVVAEGRTVAWDAYFGVKRPDRHYYVDFYPSWRGYSASWGFHLKTRKTTSG